MGVDVHYGVGYGFVVETKDLNPELFEELLEAKSQYLKFLDMDASRLFVGFVFQETESSRWNIPHLERKIDPYALHELQPAIFNGLKDWPDLQNVSFTEYRIHAFTRYS